MNIFNRENILSFFLAVVVVWFGFSEVSNPEKWLSFVPSFFGEGEVIRYMVIAHGGVLLLSGFAILFNFRRRFFAFVIALLLLAIVANFFQEGGISPTMVRDIGLFGLALGLAMRPY